MVRFLRQNRKLFTKRRVDDGVNNHPQEDYPTHNNFDDYDISLGDLMRGQRATLGKSLLDVQKEIGLAPYIIFAIENSDLEAFRNRSLIGSYVLQYSKYLGWEPNKTYARFCKETGHVSKAINEAEISHNPLFEVTNGHKFKPSSTNSISLFEHVLGGVLQKSTLIGLGAISVVSILFAGGGYLVWSFYFQVFDNPNQINTARTIGTEITTRDDTTEPDSSSTQNPFIVAVQAPNQKGLEKIGDLIPLDFEDDQASFSDWENHGSITSKYEPTKIPVEPEVVSEEERLLANLVDMEEVTKPNKILLVTDSESWVRVKDENGRVLFERVLVEGEQYEVPDTPEMLILRAGNSSNLYFVIDGITYGPSGDGTVIDNIYLNPEELRNSFAIVDGGLNLTVDHPPTEYSRFNASSDN